MKALYIIACFLLADAIMVEAIAKRHCSTAAQAVTKSMELDSQQQAQAKQDAVDLIHLGNRYSIIGLILTSLGVISLVICRVKGNKWTLVFPVVLLAAYVMIFIIRV